MVVELVDTADLKSAARKGVRVRFPAIPKNRRSWPRNGNAFVSKLKRIAPALRARGFTFSQGERTAKSRIWAFRAITDGGDAKSERGAGESFASFVSQPESYPDAPDDGNDADYTIPGPLDSVAVTRLSVAQIVQRDRLDASTARSDTALALFQG
jgi:hypothetical protein